MPPERSKPIPPSEGPYIYAPYVTKTIQELLGTSQISEDQGCEAFVIEFPPNLEIFDRAKVGSSILWVLQGWYVGKFVGPYLSRYSAKAGMTKRDRIVVAKAILEERILGRGGMY